MTTPKTPPLTELLTPAAIISPARQEYLDHPDDIWDVRKQLASNLTEYYAPTMERNPATAAWLIARGMRNAAIAPLNHLTHCELQNLLLDTEARTAVLASAPRLHQQPIEVQGAYATFSAQGLTYMHTAYSLLDAASRRVQQRMCTPGDALRAYRDLWEINNTDYLQYVKAAKTIRRPGLNDTPQGGMNMLRADNCKVSLELLTKLALFNTVTTGNSSSIYLVGQALSDADRISMLSTLHKRDGIRSFHKNRLSERLYPNPRNVFTLADALPIKNRDTDGKLQFSLKAPKDISLANAGNCPAPQPTTTPQQFAQGKEYNLAFSKHINSIAGTTVIKESDSTTFSIGTNLMRCGALIGADIILTDAIWEPQKPF